MASHLSERASVVSAWIDSPALVGLVSRVAAHYGIAAADVPDLVQETRIALWEVGSEAPPSSALMARVATNKAVDLLRNLVRRRTRDRAAALNALGAPENAELRHLLNARVDELPRQLHEFYELRYHQGMSEREIARSLGLCRASVRWLDRRCRRSLLGCDSPP
ncbi:MAG TPA: sigma-70 family RNA polymerase sigma factor [Thermoanaerobaculia bacterium]|nr:sigma-70 family RNA polymerase sigma factor [Thermoanaerobaculia bacterium]